MLDGLQHYWKVNRLQKRKQEVEDQFRFDIHKARQQSKPRDEIRNDVDRLMFDERSTMEEFDDDIQALISSRLFRLADHYVLPTPPFDQKSGDWIESRITGKWLLSPQAIAKLRTEIRKEQKETGEHWRAWAASLTGLLGALIGVLSFFAK